MRRPGRTAGFGLIEVLLTLTFLSIVVVNVGVVMRASRKAGVTDLSNDILDDQARITLRRIALALMGASRNSLTPDAGAPLDSAQIRYQSQLGFEAGAVVWDDPERILLADPAPQLLWSKNPDTDDELSVVWSNLVAPLLEGELMNGLDDNGNGLIDEKGLSFEIDRAAVTVRLTIERRDDQDRRIEATVSTTVTCRNPPMVP